MKKYLFKWKAFLLACILLITVLPADAVSVFAAAKPAMSVTSRTLIGVDQEFKLSIKNLTASKVKSTSWSSTNKKVATVSGGYVTSAGRGTAYIKCRITYKNGTVVTPSCKVTVKIPAKAIEITNAQDDLTNNSRQVIAVGDKYDFNSVLTPSNADNYITYTISNTDYATVDKKGIVTGKKPGFVTLTAKANLKKPAGYTNLLDDVLVLKDSINLEIVTKTAGVTSVELLDTTTLKVIFDKAIDEKTLIGSNEQLLNNIVITTKSDSNGVIASAVGKLSGSLSSDGKTLTIKTSGYFNGSYGIKFTRNILTKDSEPLMEYYKSLSLYDTTPPAYLDYSVDDTGLVASINFTESMNYTAIKIEDVEQVTKKNDKAKASTITRLGQKSNYKASDDGKSLSIDLSKMSSVDQDKQFKIVFSGLKDRAGNYPDNDRITAYLATDTSPKPQAKLVKLERTDTNTLTATFTRAIKTPGKVLLSNGDMITGVVNEKNTKQVTYTLDSEAAKLTGKQEVSIGYWNSYNVKDSDDSADDYKEVEVNFTIVTSVPELTGHEFYVETDDEPIYNLILTFDREVDLIEDDGTFEARLVTEDGDVFDDYLIGYSADADDTVVTVILDSDDLEEPGTYTITIPEEFVEDEYGNTNLAETVKVTNTEGSSTALPKPKDIVQSEADASIIYVTFGYQVDEDTAQDTDNYDIEDAEINTAKLIDNSTNGATVELTLEPGSISENGKYNITISGITGYHNTYTEMEKYKTKVTLHENKGPTAEDHDYTYPDKITITFDETLAGTASFQVLQNGVNLVEYCEISGKKVIIILEDKPVMDQAVQIVPTNSNHITDKYGNAAQIETESLVPTN